VYAKNIEINVWAMGNEGKLIRKIADIFEKENPKIKIVTQAIPWNGAHEKLVTSVVGNIPPDVCQLGTTWMPEFQAMKALEPVDRFLAASKSLKKDTFFPEALKTASFDNHIYGIPWYLDTRLIYFRKDILKKIGYTSFPHTWDDFFNMTEKLKKYKKDNNLPGYCMTLPGNDWQIFLIFLWQHGASIFGNELSDCLVNSPKAAKALKFYKSFFDMNLSPFEASSDMDIFNAFETGFFPIFISGPWMISEIEKNKPSLNGKWATARMPAKQNYTSFMGGSNLVIFKNTKHKEASWKFIQFLSRPEIQTAWYVLSKNLPSNRDSWNDKRISENKYLRAFKEQLAQTKSPPNIPEWENIASSISNNLESAMYGKIPVQKSLDYLKTQIDESLAKSKTKQSPAFKISIVLLIVLVFVFFLLLYLGKNPDMPTKKGGAVGISRHAGWLFLTPALTILSVFLFLPVIISFIISLTNWNIYSVNDLNSLTFTGFSNYSKLLSDPIFWISLKNTLVFSFVGVPLNIILALITAVILNQQCIKFKAFFRIGFFIPVITTMVAVAVVWRWLYNPDFGIFNWLLSLVGMSPQNWLTNPDLAIWSLIVMGVWKGFGYNMIIFIAALQSISESLYEAAEIDGATKIQQFFYITLPMLKKTTVFITIMTTIGYLQFFAEPYIMTKGGPLNSTMSVVLYMYNHGFKFYNLGYASAIAYALFGIIFIFTLFQIKISKGLEKEQ
jgi:ABC-type sugar transport system permease subunit/ABC-type glycerol-3-phosphate transport system substrate-binding protein